MKRLNELITNSAQRLAEGEEKLRETNDPAWLWFLKKESTVLLKRVISFWIKIRLTKITKNEKIK